MLVHSLSPLPGYYKDVGNVLWLKRFLRRFDKRYTSRDYRSGPGVLDAAGRKHIALRARSVNSKNAPFTATGLGDRFHCVTTGWVFSRAHDVPVVLHLTKKKQSGGQFNNKLESWYEVLSLFPKGYVELMLHDFEPEDEKSWVDYLEGKGFAAETYWYQDHPGRFETPQPIEISHYLRSIPLIPAEDLGAELDLPERFVTAQWDSNEEARTLPPERQAEVMQRYKQDGYDAVVVGGKATNPLLRNSLRHIAYAMSKAELHVGVDSAFMHMAFLYFPHERIHIYNQKKGFKSHHFRRAVDAGCPLNVHYKDI